MRMAEYQHRSEGGGNMVLLDNGDWRHGEIVLVVSKIEVHELLVRAKKLIVEMMPGVRHIALQDYKELNDVQCDLNETLRQIESSTCSRKKT
jgi:hypothetical protein